MKPRNHATPERGGAPAFFSPDVAAARRFYLDLNPPKRRKLAVVCGGLEHCTADYAIHRATFPFYSIEYVTRGSGELKLQGRTHALRAGRVFSYGPGVPHDIRGSRADPLVKYFVDFTGRDAPGLLRACGLPPGRATQVFPPHILAPLFDELIESGLSGGRGNTTLCARLLECLALKLADANAPLEETETLAFATYQHCRRHIEQHFLRLRTLEEVAAECHVNKAYLCRLFQQFDRQSPYQYLLRLKMNHAAERLQESGVLVKQAAEESGFADPFHFSRVFRKVLGMSPAAFRILR
ncbi:MAG TPA: AraC family transcriptional regulator [Candidatus Limnocylindrales bacterium]|nr:AraC family transcriptional regulator [Candidatus Limnocylindrales bacterium]